MRAAGCVSGRCGAAAARLHGIWPTPPSPRTHPDGWAQQGISEAWELIEVELTQTRPAVVALKTRPPHTAAITYYAPAALQAALDAQLAGVCGSGRPPLPHVQPLVQAGTSYGGAQ